MTVAVANTTLAVEQPQRVGACGTGWCPRRLAASRRNAYSSGSASARARSQSPPASVARPDATSQIRAREAVTVWRDQTDPKWRAASDLGFVRATGTTLLPSRSRSGISAQALGSPRPRRTENPRVVGSIPTLGTDDFSTTKRRDMRVAPIVSMVVGSTQLPTCFRYTVCYSNDPTALCCDARRGRAFWCGAQRGVAARGWAWGRVAMRSAV
jgi:hypothetical protein